jgi:hypothetical protein
MDCIPATIVSDTACFATFLSHYKGFASFTPFDVVKAGDGYYVAGYTQHIMNAEPVVMKVRLNGTVEWTRSFNNFLHGASFSVIHVTSDGNLLVAGQESRLIGHIIWDYSTLVKLSRNGDVLWAREIRGELNDLQPAEMVSTSA